MSYFVPNSGGAVVNGIGDATDNAVKVIADALTGLTFGLPVLPFRITVEQYFDKNKADFDLLNSAKQSRFVLPRSSTNDLVTATKVAENIVAAKEAARAKLAQAGADVPAPSTPSLPTIGGSLGGVPLPVLLGGAALVGIVVLKKLKVF